MHADDERSEDERTDTDEALLEGGAGIGSASTEGRTESASGKGLADNAHSPGYQEPPEADDDTKAHAEAPFRRERSPE